MAAGVKQFNVPVDMQKLEVRNQRVHVLASAPSSPVTGQIYYNSGDNTLYWYNNTTWVAAKDAGATSVFYQTVKDDGTARTQRSNLNFVSTTSVAASVADNSGADGSDVTVDVQYGSVTAETSFGISSANGSAGTAARSDHTHGTPAAPTASSVGAVANNGNAPYLQTGTAAGRPSTGLTVGGVYVDNDDFLAWVATSTTVYSQVAPFGSAGAMVASAVGDSAGAGTALTYARIDHKHAREAFGAVTAQTTFGASSANGSATTVSHSDHTHGTPATPTASAVGAVANNGGAPGLQTGTAASKPSSGQSVGNIYVDNDDGLLWIFTSATASTQLVPFGVVGSMVASAVGDTAAVGTGITYSRIDHKHAREAFGNVTAQTSYGASSANGSATTVSHSDHVHGTPSLTANTPSTQAIGDSAVVGTGTAPARDDHKHAMPAFGAPTSETTFGTSSATGSAVTVPHSDHTHGNPTHDATAHSAIHLNDLATATGSYNLGGFLITNVGTPSAASDIATKGYVDGLAQGQDFKSSVRVATTANGTLATAYENGDTVDGVTLATGDRILIKNQTTASENGIYTVNASGAPTRTTDADTTGDLSVGSQTYVESGTANGAQIWVVSATGATPWVPNSSTSTWVLYFAITSTQAGGGLTASGNVLAVGAGTGITVNADSVQVDRTTNGSKVAMIYATDIGDGAATAYVVTHNLGSRDVYVVTFPNASPWDEQEVDVEHTSTNTCTLRFATAPASAAYRAVVFG